MTINGNRTLRITAEGLGGDSYYVQGVKINEMRWGGNWSELEDAMTEGGMIELCWE